MASRNPDVRKLMQRVADGKAEPQELARFQRIVDNTQENLESQRRNDQQGRLTKNGMQPPAPSMPSPDNGPNYDAASPASRETWTTNHSIYNHLMSWSRDNETRTIDSDNVFNIEGLEGSSSQSLSPPVKQLAPFTDSGYASGINVSNLPRMETGDADTPEYDGNDLDVRTTYSGTSTAAVDQAQRYISELSSTIHGRLSGSIDVDHWMSLSERVLGLIKDFAIKLGLESSSQVNRDIMHFIHKRSREIATQLDSLVLCVDTSTEDADKSIEARRDHMLLSDKMALWNSKATEVEISVKDNELFVGVTDEEEIIDAPELSKYNKTVIESNSFKWLIESLRRELALRRDFDESGGCNYHEILRRRVIENLPTGKISKNRPPSTHSVAFRVPGWAFLGSAEVNRHEPGRPPYDAIVVTCSSGDAQAAIIEDYMEQTWPSTWRTIFNLLRTVSRNPSGIVFADVLHDKTQVSVSYEHDILIMSLHGPAHTITECGEQLAWLRASYASTPPHHVISSTLQQIPVIMNMARLHVGDSVPTLGRNLRLSDDDSLYASGPSSLMLESHGAESPKSTASSGKVIVGMEDMEIVSNLLWDNDANSWTSYQYLDGDPLYSSEEFETLTSDDPMRAVLDLVVSRLVSGFRYAADGGVPPCGNEQDLGMVSSSSCRGIAASTRPAGKGRKRKQVQDDNSDSEDDATHPRPSKRSKKTQQHIKLLACPFGKMSPSKYSACSRFQLKRIRDVKQHLKRKHTPDDYCNRCLSIFDDEESLTQHVSQPDGFGCQLAPEGRMLDGITHRQSRDLSRKANAELSEEQQWFAIWDIVFPQKPRPESAYLDSAFAMQVCLFREHCARHAEPLLFQNLRAAGLLDEGRWAADQEQLLRRVIAESLDSVCDTFSTNGSSDSGIGRNRNSTRNETPAASLVDSGIGIGSHFQPRTASFATASNSQQNIRPVPTDVPADFQTLGSEEGAVLGSQSFASLHQPGALGQSSTADFPLDHDRPSVEHGPDELGIFDFNLSTDLPPLELSSWTFPQTELIPHKEGVENAV
ncbi:hypothetical protein CNYM01_01065 [Colletotrichum nymphaeae SA-01]|uniref:C2H2-type domain-containing protein n=1 Tax=Colletotrichum nymphaeae SA-01 TaxID=1460502 RepID=A0A135SEC2_9PEZI|nr:hypothetical protein CNYM01_01065 [Colletotrichum nymphaeae SA-01]